VSAQEREGWRAARVKLTPEAIEERRLALAAIRDDANLTAQLATRLEPGSARDTIAALADRMEAAAQAEVMFWTILDPWLVFFGPGKDRSAERQEREAREAAARDLAAADAKERASTVPRNEVFGPPAPAAAAKAKPGPKPKNPFGTFKTANKKGSALDVAASKRGLKTGSLTPKNPPATPSSSLKSGGLKTGKVGEAWGNRNAKNVRKPKRAKPRSARRKN